MKNWWTENSKWLIPTMAFLLGVVVSAVGSYFMFMSRLDTMEFKVDYMYEDHKEETVNIYDVFHTQNNKIKNLDTLYHRIIRSIQ